MRIPRGRLVVVVAAASLVVGVQASSTPSAAVVATGGTTTNCAGLQAALDGSTAGDVVTLDGICTGTFTLPSHAITFQGDPATGAATDGFDGDTGESRTGPLLTGFDIGDTTIQKLVFRNALVSDASGAGLTVTGASAPQLIDLEFTDNDVMELEASGGNGGGLAIRSADPGGATLLQDVTFSGNSASGHGGGFYLDTRSDLTLDNVTATGNESNAPAEGPGFEGGGGGLVILSTGAAPSGALTVTDSTFTGNAATGGNGGGLSVFSLDTELDMTLTGNTFGSAESGNTAGVAGGGLYLVAGGDVTLADNTLTDNEAEGASGGDGGGAYIVGGADTGTGTLTVSGNTLTGNHTPGSGGGAYLALVQDAAAVLEANRFTGNAVTVSETADHFGGGLYIEWMGGAAPDGFLVEQTGNVFDGNTVAAAGEGESGGGGEWIELAPTRSRSDRFTNNSVSNDGDDDAEGGGLGFEDFGVLTVDLALENAVVAGNSLDNDGEGGSGGGIYVGCSECGTDLALENVTVSGNTVTAPIAAAGVGGTGLDTLTVENSIVAGNTTTDGEGTADITGFGETTVSFSDACTGPDLTGGPYDGTGNICADPLLADPTPGTADVHQTVASPTIDAGSNALIPAELTEDMDGDARVLDGDKDGSAVVDMGADELVPTAETTETTEETEPTPGDGVTPPGSIGENDGYCLGAADGGVFAFGNCAFAGAARAKDVRAAAVGAPSGAKLAAPMVGIAMTPDDKGYWMAGADGGVFAFGSAQFKGSLGGITLQKPIVGIAATPTGQGYWLVASDGGVFAFGDAKPHGSMSGVRLNQPIVAMAVTPSGQGYWLAAADGGVFAFGDATFRGSTGSIRLNRPMIGLAAAPGGTGYWLVAEDGGVFAFGSARFFGSFGSTRLNKPIVAIKGTSTGNGYWLVASDGGVFSFGSAPFRGSTGTLVLNQPIVDMTG